MIFQKLPSSFLPIFQFTKNKIPPYVSHTKTRKSHCDWLSIIAKSYSLPHPYTQNALHRPITDADIRHRADTHRQLWLSLKNLNSSSHKIGRTPHRHNIINWAIAFLSAHEQAIQTARVVIKHSCGGLYEDFYLNRSCKVCFALVWRWKCGCVAYECGAADHVTGKRLQSSDGEG